MTIALVVMQIPSYFAPLAKEIPQGVAATILPPTAPPLAISTSFDTATRVMTPGQTWLFMWQVANTGTSTWTLDTSTEVNLSVCVQAATPTRSQFRIDCDQPSPNSTWNADWTSPTRYRRQPVNVPPGGITAYDWSVTVPDGTPAGEYTFLATFVQVGTGGARSQTFKQMVRVPDPSGTVIIVDSTSDGDFCDSGCTLRGAINQANANDSPTPTFDTIIFNVDGTTIAPLSPLPEITGPVIIDATTEPSFRGTPVIELNGASAGPGAVGLALGSGSGGSTIRGLAVNRFAGWGIEATAGGVGLIAGNFIGTDLTGTLARGNGTTGDIGTGGIRLRTPGYVVGTMAFGDTNVISGNLGLGIEIGSADAPGTFVLGNIIGAGLGRAALPNAESGVVVLSLDARVQDNLIANNGGAGISIAANNGTYFDNIIRGNTVSGVLLAGTGNAFEKNDVRNNGSSGFYVGFPESTTRNNRFDDNVVVDNSGFGFVLRGPDSNLTEITDRNTIRRGSISGNTLAGIRLDTGANNNIAPPRITRVDTGDGLVVEGTAEPNAFVDIYTDPTDEGLEYLGTAQANSAGSWSKSSGWAVTDLTAVIIAIDERTRVVRATQTRTEGTLFTPVETSQFSEKLTADVDGTATCGEGTLRGATVQLLQNGTVLAETTSDSVTGDYTFEGVSPGTYTVKYILGDQVCMQELTIHGDAEVDFGEAQQCDPSNTWLTAQPLDATLTGLRAPTLGVICDGGRLWYKIRIPTPPAGSSFTVPPLSRIVARLTGTDGGRLPGDFTLMLMKDPNLALQQVNNSTDAHTQFAGDTFGGDTFGGDTFGGDTFGGDTFGGDTFGGDTFGGDTFGGDTFGGDTFGGDTFGGDTFGGDTFGGDTFGGDTFGGDTFGGDTFGGDTFGGDTFGDQLALKGGDPRAYSAAIARSVVRISAHRGTSQEGLWQNTWANSITWYLRVSSYRGSAGPFHLSTQVFSGLCDGVTISSTTSLLPLPLAANNYDTLILRNSVTEGTFAAANLTALQSLAAHATVRGHIADFALDAGLTAAYQQYKDHPFCPSAANVIAEAVRGYIAAFKAANPELKWILIAASDEGLPLYRVPDYASIAPQSMLVLPLRPLTVEGGLRLNFFGTDDAYADLNPVRKTDHFLFIPELGVGRLSEPKYFETMVGTYLAVNGVLTPQTAGVYGYNFWNDSANSIAAQLTQSGKSVNQFATARPKIQSGQGLPTDADAWNAQDLLDGVAANTDIFVLMAHGLKAAEIAPANYFPTVKPQEFINVASTTPAIKRMKLLVSGACNFALGVPSAQGLPNLTPDPETSEIPQALGWTAVAWDTYAYGDDERIAYSEELADDLFRELRYGAANELIVLGDAIARVKRDWAARQTDLKGIQQKSLMGMSVLGFPMLRVNMGAVGRLGLRPTGLASFTSGQLVDVVTGPGSQDELDLRTRDININFNDAAQQLQRRNVPLANLGAAGTTTASYYQVASGGRTFVQMNPNEPITPSWSVGLHPSDDPLGTGSIFARGAVLMSATCLDEPNFIPLISAPGYQLTPPRGPYYTDRFEPNDWWEVNYLNSGREFLLIRPGVYRSATAATGAPEIFGAERTFRQVSFRAYYSSLVGAEVRDSANNAMQAIHAGPPEFLQHTATPNGNAVSFEAIMSALPNVGVQDVFVTWWNEAATCGPTGSGINSFALTHDGTSQRWFGSLTLPAGVNASDVRYLLQAVNGAGRARVADNFGLGFPAETPPTLPAPLVDTALAFVAPTPTTAVSGRTITVAANLTRSDSNANVAGKRLIFRLSGANGDRAFGFTAANGVATANLDVDALPGDFFVHVEFEGDDDLAGSSARSAEITVMKETTTFTDLSLSPASQQQGGPIQVSARLRDGLSRPIREQTVLFLITGTDCIDYPDNGASCTVLQAHAVETDFAGRARASIPLRVAPGASYRVHVAFAGKVNVPSGGIPAFVMLNLENARYEPDRKFIGAVAVVNERIAFTSSRTGNGDIYVMNANGTGVTRITDSSAIDADPDWSPDRTKIAFSSSRTGFGDVYVMNADGTGLTRLTTTNAIDTFGSWSPDGSKIAFTSTRDGNAEIYVMNADGTGQTRLTNNSSFDADPFWSPDGTKIAFTSGRTGNGDVYVMNANGTNVTRITNDPAVDTLGSWSPDGSKIVFTRGRAGNGDIYTMNPNGTGVTRLTTSSGTDGAPDWSPDGTKIVFASNRDGNSEIYLMNANGTGQTRLTTNSAFDSLPSW